MNNTMQDAHNLIDNTVLLDRMGYETFETTYAELEQRYIDLCDDIEALRDLSSESEELGHKLLELLDVEYLMRCANMARR